MAAVAVLQDSQMSDQEALEIIGAIAGWVDKASDRSRENCGRVVHRIHEIIGTSDVDTLTDREAGLLLSQVGLALDGSETAHPRLG